MHLDKVFKPSKNGHIEVAVRSRVIATNKGIICASRSRVF